VPHPNQGYSKTAKEVREMKVIMIIVSYLIFGIVDNAIMYSTGKRLEDKIEEFVLRITKGRYRLREGSRVAFLCAAIGNGISDLCGGIIGCNVYLGIFSFIGCMLVAVWIARRTFERVV